MNLNKALRERKSVRNFSDKDIKDDRLIDAIEAATLAPSPGNLQILKYIIVEDEKDIEKIATACQQSFIKKAPIVVVVCSEKGNVERMYDKRAETYIKHHVGCAVENLLLKVTDMKIASCWVGAFSETQIKNILKIPADVDVEVILPIGYESKTKKTTQKSKPNLGNVVYFDEYNNKYKKKPRKMRNH